jgi:type II secretory ATPase GspE/PulE/Tfp pilus assembly ATPase PilB-like protein
MAQTPAEGVVELVNELLRRALAARASDVHFEPGRTGLRVRFRVDALLTDVEDVPAAIAPNVVARLKVMAGLLTYRSDLPQEGSIANVPGLPRWRYSRGDVPTIYGERCGAALAGRDGARADAG